MFASALLSAAVLALAPCAAVAQRPSEAPRTSGRPDFVDWQPSLDAATEASRTSGRPVIAYFTFDTCHWCKVLERQTLSRPMLRDELARFHWVYVDRDEHPGLVEELNVSAYPGLLVLGRDLENVHRFHGYHDVDELRAQLREADRRWGIHLDGGRWWSVPDSEPLIAAAPAPDAATSGPESLAVDPGTVATTDLPDAADHDADPFRRVPTGAAWLDDDAPGRIRMLVVAGGALHARRFSWDPESGRAPSGVDGAWRRLAWDLPSGPQDLAVLQAGRRKLVLVLPMDFTSGGAVTAHDPDDGTVVQRIALREPVSERAQARGLAVDRDGNLRVLTIFGELLTVSPADGALLRRDALGLKWTFGLEEVGAGFLCAARDGVHALALDDGGVPQVVAHLPTPRPLRALAATPPTGVGIAEASADGRRVAVHLLEQPVFGHGPRHERVVVSPRPSRMTSVLARLPRELVRAAGGVR